jgi:hypothetical protein
MKEVRFTKELMEEKIKEDCFFIKEELLTSMPLDWFDFCTACHAAMYSNLEAHVVILDDEATERMMRIYVKGEVELFVLDRNNEKIWQLMVIKNQDDMPTFAGGENLRKFCDKENIFYESIILNNELMSFSNLKYLKDPGEDCRIPLSEEEKQKRIDKHKDKK